jgi:hypothetical protein
MYCDRERPIKVSECEREKERHLIMFSGVWHVEGMPTEMIVGSAIYYYSSSPFIEDDGLAFRKERNIESDWPTYMDCKRRERRALF